MPAVMSRAESLVDRILGGVARRINAWPRTWIAVATVLAVGGGILAALELEMETDQNELVSNDLAYNQRYLEYLDEFGDQEHLFVVIRTTEMDRGRQIARDVAGEMEPLIREGLVEECIVRIDSSGLEGEALLLLEERLLGELVRQLEPGSEKLRALLELEGGLPGLLEEVEGFLAAAASTAERESEGPDLRFGLGLLERLLESLHRALDTDPETAPAPRALTAADLLADPLLKGLLDGPPWKELIDPEWLTAAAADGYFFFGDLCFVLLMPAKDYQTLAVIGEPLERIREALERVRLRHPDVPIGLTGRPVLQADEMTTTERDMTWAASIALGAVVVIFMIFFRAVRRPALTGLALVIALGITFGLITLTVGHLNLLSSVFAVMLVSLGTDFGVHVIARYQEELATGIGVEQALIRAQVAAGKANLTGATTTAAAFYTTLLIDFQGLAELGFIAGTGVLVCMVVMNTVLPALLRVTDGRVDGQSVRAPIRLRLLLPVCRHPGQVLPLVLALLVLGGGGLAAVRFDSNLLALQAEDLDSVRYEKLITENEGIKTWYATYLASDLEEVHELVRRLRDPAHADVISKVESVLDYVPPDQEARRARVGELKRLLAGEDGRLRLAPLPAALSLDDLVASLEGLLDRLEGLLSGALRRGIAEAAVLERPLERVDDLLERIEEMPDVARERLRAFEVRSHERLDGLLTGLARLLEPGTIELEDLDPFLRHRLRSPTSGRYLVYAYPARDIWVEEDMEAFIRTTESIDPEVTGVPAQVYHSTRIMKRGFILAAVYALVAVLVLVWIDFRRPLDCLLALVPVGVGMILTLSLMPRLGLAFNLANFFAVPIIIGTGINGGVHLIHRFRERRQERLQSGDGLVPGLAISSTGTSVVLSELTTITALGMLMIAEHRGLASLGGLLVLGCLSCLLASLLVLLPLLALLDDRRARES